MAVQDNKIVEQIIEQTKKVLGIDKIPNLRDFSIHFKHESIIEVEIHAFNEDWQLEKIVQIFKSPSFNLNGNESVLSSPESAAASVSSILEKIKSKDTRMSGPDVKQMRRHIFHERIYDTVYCLVPDLPFDKEGLTIKCSGDFIIHHDPPDPNYINNDLILENLNGVKEILTFVPIMESVK